MSYDRKNEAQLCATLLADPRSAVVVRFNMAGRHAMDFIDLRHGGPHELPAERVAEFNTFLHGSVVIVARRDDAIPAQALLTGTAFLKF